MLIYFLYKLFSCLGWSYLGGGSVMVFLMIFDKYFNKTKHAMESKMNIMRDRRHNMTQETFLNIKMIKQYGLQLFYKNEIKKIKEDEIKIRFDLAQSLVFGKFLGMFLPSIMSSLSLAIFFSQGYQLDLASIIEILILFNHVKEPMEACIFNLRSTYKGRQISLQVFSLFMSTKEMKQDKVVQRLPLEAPQSKKEETKKAANSGAVKPVQEQIAVQIEDRHFTWGLKTMDFDDKMDEITRAVWKIKRTKPEDIREHEASMKKKEEHRTQQRKLDAAISLKNINISIKKGQLVFIVGKVASGKSSLLSAIIGDLMPVPQKLVDSYGGPEGLQKALTDQEAEAFMSDVADQQHDKDFKPAVVMRGSLSYTHQVPWIQNKVVRDNILYNKSMDVGRYVDTIQYCELESDLKELKSGDQAEIGERGINLSGGQKARIGLARAVYQDSDIYLMDDPISALDSHVRKQIMSNVINGVLSKKTRILVTHAVDFMHLADHIIIMDQGRIAAQGLYNDLKKN